MLENFKELKIINFKTITTTMNVALKYLDLVGEKDLLILAEEQTASIGRKDNIWHSPIGGFWGTYIFKLKAMYSEKQLSFLHLAVALAVKESIKEMLDLPIHVKWPNDIIFNSFNWYWYKHQQFLLEIS
ncbi:MAG: biotin--[acetyl-CoA-carboxylase] ligase [Candidatus Heimdallarchaeaceae archaeon]